MTTTTKLGAFAMIVAIAFVAMLGVGNAVGPIGVDEDHGGGHQDTADGAPAAGGDAGEDGTDEGASATPPGLAVSEDGYTLVVDDTDLEPGRAEELRFRIVGPDGAPLKDYETLHERDLHLIVASRDLSEYQHLHPERTDGTWSVPLTVPEAGVYRAFADFEPAGHGTNLTLGTDLVAAGDYQPTELGAPAFVAEVGGYRVELGGRPVAGEEVELDFTVTRGGQPVDDLQPYLGAYGHLVALRDGDLAYLHVHPLGDAPDGPGGPGVGFALEAPSTGSYRLFLDFRHDGEVRTAAFTVEVAEGTTVQTDHDKTDDDKTDDDANDGADRGPVTEEDPDDGHH